MLDTWQQYTRFDLPLSEDLPAAVLANACELDPIALYGRGALSPGPGGQQLDALFADHKLTYPATTAQRIRWIEAASARDILPADLNLTTGTTWEVARVVVPSAALGQIERVGTYLLLQPLENAGPLGPAFEFIPTPNVGVTLPNTVSGPFPFPVAHPTIGVRPLIVRWDLRVEDLSDVAPNPFGTVLADGRLSQLPPESLLPFWTDMRSGWGSRYSENKKLLVQGHVRVRLFGTVFAQTDMWDVRVGGTLQGFWQLGGPCGEARDTATHRH